MDNEEAKLILSAFRPGGEDGSDPFFAEALERARVDPELAGWFAQEQKFDRDMVRELQAQEPPERLRQSLLHGSKVILLPRARPLWARPVSWIALAAALAVFFGLGLLSQQSRRPTVTGAQLAREVIELAESGNIAHGKVSVNPDELKSWLATRGSPHDFTIPAGLSGYPGVGCQAYLLNGIKVSLICFQLANEEVVHLFVVDQDALKNAPGELPSIIRDRDKVAATWSAGGKTFVLMGMQTSEETLRRLI